MRFRVSLVAALTALSAAAVPTIVSAQDEPAGHQHDMHDMHDMSAPEPRWTWSGDGNVFFGYNYQQRRYVDEKRWESQNWFMGMGQRRVGRGNLTIEAMLSLEPFTMNPKGSPQLFQTGEVYQGVPLVNYQHPHDLFMELGATYRWTAGRLGYIVGADLVGDPTLGPTPFMHRESARDNPQVPLSHHSMDSTHSTPGVVRAGVVAGFLTFEGSVFRGAEPDDHRTDLERPALDSWALRARFDRGSWHAQFSGGHLKQPEAFEPFDQSRLTASVSYDGAIRTRPLHVTGAWGGIREFNGFNGNVDIFLFEGEYRPWRAGTIYGRLETGKKEVLGLEFHTRALSHPHFFYELNVPTFGYIVELPWTKAGQFGIGADVTLYDMPEQLGQFYDPAHSYHVFLRWRPTLAPQHMHH